MKDENKTLPHIENDLAEKVNYDHWCMAYYAGDENADYKERAGLLLQTAWNAGDIITITFLDGERVLQEKVIASAKEWVSSGLANLTFNFILDPSNDLFTDPTKRSDIRISFKYPGSWSVLGTTCKTITDKTKPTMNFGWLNERTPDEEIRRVVLHEFGHALGLIHEHMTPADGGIKWDKAQVEKDLSGPPNYWSEDVIFNNMFKTFSPELLKLTRLDKGSIMMYPIPAKWTTDGFNVGLNTNLSDCDKKFIADIYQGNNL